MRLSRDGEVVVIHDARSRARPAPTVTSGSAARTSSRGWTPAVVRPAFSRRARAAPRRPSHASPGADQRRAPGGGRRGPARAVVDLVRSAAARARARLVVSGRAPRRAARARRRAADRPPVRGAARDARRGRATGGPSSIRASASAPRAARRACSNPGCECSSGRSTTRPSRTSSSTAASTESSRIALPSCARDAPDRRPADRAVRGVRHELDMVNARPPNSRSP